MSTTDDTGRPGKYQRSAFGLVVAMVTTVVAIGAVLWFMGLFRDTPDTKPTPVAYRQAVAALQRGGKVVVYPASLPDGYIATQARVPDDDDGFEIDLLKGADDFIGIRMANTAVLAALVHQDVDPDASTTTAYDVPASVASPVARTWAGYRDGRGDTGYAAEADGLKVLVYGSAPPADLQQVIDLLTTARQKLE